MPRTEQSASWTGHEKTQRCGLRVVTSTAENCELEDMTQAFGARIPASLTLFSADGDSLRIDPMHGAHPFS